MLQLRSLDQSVRAFWRYGTRAERTGYVVGVLLLLSGLAHLAVLSVTGASWEGPVSLRKPMTFGLSFGITLITIVWVSSFLRLSDRARARLLVAFTVASVLETALITLQAWRGVPSHFNLETPFDAAVARSLAAGGVALVAIVIVLTVAAFRQNPDVSPSLRLGVRVGFVLLCGSLAVGGVMIARGMILVAAGHPDVAYAVGGALRPTHAVTMHAVLVLPALAWLLSFTDWSERRQFGVVLAASSACVLLVVLVAVANLLSPVSVPLAH